MIAQIVIASSKNIEFLGVWKHLYKRLCLLVGQSVCRSVCPHITLSVIFSAVHGRIDLKFGGDLHVDLLFQFLIFFFLNSSNSSFSSEIEFNCN